MNKFHISDCTCKAYALSKAHRHLSRKPMTKESKPYAKLHVDTIGPITPTSYFGQRYLQTVSEDSSRVRHYKTSDSKVGLDKELTAFIENTENILSTPSHPVIVNETIVIVQDEAHSQRSYATYVVSVPSIGIIREYTFRLGGLLFSLELVGRDLKNAPSACHSRGRHKSCPYHCSCSCA